MPNSDIDEVEDDEGDAALDDEDPEAVDGGDEQEYDNEDAGDAEDNPDAAAGAEPPTGTGAATDSKTDSKNDATDGSKADAPTKGDAKAKSKKPAADPVAFIRARQRKVPKSEKRTALPPEYRRGEIIVKRGHFEDADRLRRRLGKGTVDLVKDAKGQYLLRFRDLWVPNYEVQDVYIIVLCKPLSWANTLLLHRHQIVIPLECGLSGMVHGSIASHGSFEQVLKIRFPERISAVFVGKPPDAQPFSTRTVLHALAKMEPFSYYDVDPASAAQVDQLLQFVHECQRRILDEDAQLARAPDVKELTDDAEEWFNWAHGTEYWNIVHEGLKLPAIKPYARMVFAACDFRHRSMVDKRMLGTALAALRLALTGPLKRIHPSDAFGICARPSAGGEGIWMDYPRYLGALRLVRESNNEVALSKALQAFQQADKSNTGRLNEEQFLQAWVSAINVPEVLTENKLPSMQIGLGYSLEQLLLRDQRQVLQLFETADIDRRRRVSELVGYIMKTVVVPEPVEPDAVDDRTLTQERRANRVKWHQEDVRRRRMAAEEAEQQARDQAMETKLRSALEVVQARRTALRERTNVIMRRLKDKEEAILRTSKGEDQLNLPGEGMIYIPNKLFTTPTAQDRLNQIVTMDLSHNRLEALPDQFHENQAAIKAGTPESALVPTVRPIPELGTTVNFFYHCYELKRLDLSHNELKVLPEAIAEAKLLQVLRLDNNFLQHLPDSIGRLANLQLLSASNNRLSVLPSTIGRLTALVSLTLHTNNLTCLPEISVPSEEEYEQLVSTQAERARRSSTVDDLLHSPRDIEATKEEQELMEALEVYAKALEEAEHRVQVINGRAPPILEPDVIIPDGVTDIRLLPGFAALRMQSSQDVHTLLKALRDRDPRTRQTLAAKVRAAQAEAKAAEYVLDETGALVHISSLAKPKLSGLAMWLDAQNYKPAASPRKPPTYAQRVSYCLQSLTHLDLAMNFIQRLPDWLSGVTALSHLNLNWNGLLTVPSATGGFPALRELQVCRSDFAFHGLLQDHRDYDPGNLQNIFPSMQVIKASRCALRVLPRAVGAFKNCLWLDLQWNELTSLPEEIGDMARLETLNIANNVLEELPPSLGMLKALRILDLRDNKLVRLPDEVAGLDSLLSLDASKNKLTEMPLGIRFMTSLQELQLRYNRIANMPHRFHRMINLRVMDVRDNLLGALPEDYWPPNLTHLHAAKNNVGSFPVSLCSIVSLMVVDVAHNHITSIPREAALLTNLVQLDVRFNRIQGFPLEMAPLFAPPNEGRLQLLTAGNPLKQVAAAGGMWAGGVWRAEDGDMPDAQVVEFLLEQASVRVVSAAVWEELGPITEPRRFTQLVAERFGGAWHDGLAGFVHKMHTYYRIRDDVALPAPAADRVTDAVRGDRLYARWNHDIAARAVPAGEWAKVHMPALPKAQDSSTWIKAWKDQPTTTFDEDGDDDRKSAGTLGPASPQKHWGWSRLQHYEPPPREQWDRNLWSERGAALYAAAVKKHDEEAELQAKVADTRAKLRELFNRPSGSTSVVSAREHGSGDARQD